jgi:hypothetical protein
MGGRSTREDIVSKMITKWNMSHRRLGFFFNNNRKFIVDSVPSIVLGRLGRRSGMSSADIPSTQSTTDLGRILRPCRPFRFA